MAALRADGKGFRAAVVGAGPAGLAAALTLSRSLQPTIVFDADHEARNASSPAIGGFVGRDAIAPLDLRRQARAEILRYGYVKFSDQWVVGVEGDPSHGFQIRATDGTNTRADTVLLSCGVVDQLPDFEGLNRFWGSSVINCPFCHGFELRNRPWAVLVNRQAMLEVAEIYRMWSDDLLLLLEPEIELSPDRHRELKTMGIDIERKRVRALLGDAALSTIELDDGTRLKRDALVLWPHQEQTALVGALGLPLNEEGSVIVDAGFRTEIEGLYAAGDLLYTGHQNVSTAVHMGNLAAATMVLDLSKRL